MKSRNKRVGVVGYEGWRRGQGSDREGKTNLEEARGHGTTWHGVVGGHVAHHWAGRRRCALKHTNTAIQCGVLVSES